MQKASHHSDAITRRSFLLYTLSTGAILALPSILTPTIAYGKDLGDASGRDTTFADDAGRTLRLPTSISKVSPSGAYAQSILETLCPEKMVTVARSPVPETRATENADGLGASPAKSGSIYAGGSDTFDANIVRDAMPDLIIDIGDQKNTLQDKLDNLEESLSTPTIFLDGSLEKLPDSYRQLGTLLGCCDRAEELAQYIEDLRAFLVSRAPLASCRKRVLFAGGTTGLSVRSPETYHSAAIEYACGISVARYNGSEGSVDVDFADVAAWAPDLIIFPNRTCYDNICNGVEEWALWQALPAIIEGRFNVVPETAGESWFGTPLFIQTIGTLWLGSILHPDIFNYDIYDVCSRFYQAFFSASVDVSTARTNVEDALDQKNSVSAPN